MKEEALDKEMIDDNSVVVAKLWPAYGWFGALALGLIFKFMHWPGANIVIILSSSGIAAYSITHYFLIKVKTTFNLILSVISLFWIGIIIWGMNFNGGYPYNGSGFEMFLALLIINSIFILLLRRLRKR